MQKIICAAALLLVATTQASATDITACGAVVARDDTGVLQADLDCATSFTYHCLSDRSIACTCSGNPIGGCSSSPECPPLPPPMVPFCGRDPDVILAPRATLNMNGHSLSGGDVGVACEAHCTVTGPGAITGAEFGIRGRARGTATLSDLDVTGCGDGLTDFTAHFSVDATNVNISGNSGSGIVARNLRATNVTTNNNGSGGNPGDNFGIYVYRRLHATHVSANNNGFGVVVFHGSRVTDLTASNNALGGVTAYHSAHFDGLTAQDNGGVGFFGERPRLLNSTVTGNINDGLPLDILSERHPRLVNTTCDQSARLNEADHTIGETWGVCAGD